VSDRKFIWVIKGDKINSCIGDFHKSFDAAVPQVMKLLHTMSPFESPRIIGRLAKHSMITYNFSLLI
jgi:hypothetical protein